MRLIGSRKIPTMSDQAKKQFPSFCRGCNASIKILDLDTIVLSAAGIPLSLVCGGTCWVTLLLRTRYSYEPLSAVRNVLPSISQFPS